MDNKYQQCTKTVMDNIADPFITFDKDGVCNYYHEYFELEKKFVIQGQEGLNLLDKKIEEIKEAGKNKEYDCVIGLSGGVDSSYLAYFAKKNNLKPLIVHFDNGWNSELAVKNIESIISKLGFDLYTYVIDWEEFKDVQLSYLIASVIDIEAITDHAITAVLYKLAKKHNLKYSLNGYNIVTEGILPRAWVFDKLDSTNLRSIHGTYGKVKLKTFPLYDFWKKRYYRMALSIESVRPLNYIDYNKDKIKQILIDKLDWKDYGGKHYESVWTRFYQGHILPNKFKVDKRKAHLSTLICSGQMTKEEAIEELKTPIYDAKQLEIDKEFVLKKLGLSKVEFKRIMDLPVRSHTDFETEAGSYFDKYPILKPIQRIYKTIKK